jgi:hypothetical protein
MNRSGNIFFCLCAALLLAADMGRAETVIWSDGFEANVPSRWTATGAWQIGPPTKGPSSANSGANCASTQNYLYNQDGRIVCTNYLNGSNSLVVPAASVSPTLIFWHWVKLANALGYVEISTNAGSSWQQISSTYLDVTSGGVWLQESLDLGAFAGQSVQIAFHFTSGSCCGNAQGWYVDDVSLTEVVTNPPTLIVPDTQTIYAGQTLTVTNSATNSFLPNATYTFKLLSPPANVSITSKGVLTWPTTIAQPPGTNTITVKVTDNSTPPLTATNSFEVVVVNPFVPVLTVPGPQFIYAGQQPPLVVTVSATNDFFPSDTFTFALLSGLTNVNANLDVSELTNNGVLSWATTTALKAGTYTNVIKVTDNGPPYFSATNSFVIVVSNPPPPVLTMPPTQTIYAGRRLDVTISAHNDVFPDATYSFDTNSAPAGVSIDSATGVLTWTPTAAQAPNVYSISVKVTDNNSPPLGATGSFLVIVSPTPPPPILMVPGTQTIHAGQTLPVPISATNIFVPDSQFTFRLPSPSTNYWIDPNSGVLTWTNTGIINGVLTWTNNSVSPGTNLISVIVSDDSVPALSATNHFALVFLPPLPPILTVPNNQTIYAGQTLIVTNFATNAFLPNASYTFSLPSVSTNVSITSNGVLTWTNTAALPGTNQVSVKVTDNSVPPLSATKDFSVIIIILPPPPALIVSNTLFSSNPFQFSFQTRSNTTWRIDASTDLLNWLPISTNAAGSDGTLQFTDLLATNYPWRFYRAVSP